MYDPTVTKTFAATAVATETTVWTPTTGKKFRLLKMLVTSSVAGNLVFKDNTAGTTILVVPCLAGAPVSVDLGRLGIASAAINNVLTVTGPATATMSGFIQGVEEN